MSDQSIRGKGDGESSALVSRRQFIGGAVAVVGTAGLMFGQRGVPASFFEKPIPPDGPASVDCGCVNEAALPLTAVATVGGKYYGLAGTEFGPQIVTLDIGKDRRVSFGSPLEIGLPKDFVFGSIGTVRAGLAVSGGVPFVLETLDVDHELTGDVRAAMDNSIPDGIPTSGRERVEIMGLEPGVFAVRGTGTERLLLPDMPKRSFAVATAITRSANGGMALLIEHSDGVNESYYASAIDVVEENGSNWKTWNAGRNLGESGPNFLAESGGRLTAGVNLAEGSYLVEEGTEKSAKADISPNRIVALIPGPTGISALVKDRAGRQAWSSALADGRLAAGRAAEMKGDEIVGAVAVGGAIGQVILLGRKSAVLAENIPAFVSRAKGGDRHVM